MKLSSTQSEARADKGGISGLLIRKEGMSGVSSWSCGTARANIVEAQSSWI